MTPKHNNLTRTKKTKLEQVLEQISLKDIRKLKKFIASPYFNSSIQIVNLLNLHISTLKQDRILPDNPDVWQKIGAKGAYNDVRFRKFHSDLTQLIIKFVALEELQDNLTSLNLFAMQAVRKKNIKALERTMLRVLDTRVKENNSISVENLQNNLNFEKERYLLQYKNKRIKDTNLSEILNILDQYYISEKFKFATDLKSRSRYISRDTSVFLMDDIYKSLDEKKITLHPIGQIYKLVYETQNDDVDGDSSYQELEQLLLEINQDLDPAEANSIYNSLINYCIGKINTGDQEYLGKLLNIYKALIQLGLILENDRIDPTMYRNIVVTALRQGASDWAEQFAKDYEKHLPIQEKENQFRFQLSVIYFYKKEFDKVIEVLRDFEFNDLLDNLRTKATLIQTYYELNEFETLDSLLKSLRTYITRHKELDSGRRSNYKNLIKIMTQMIQIIPGDKKKIDKLRSMLSEMKGIAVNRTWLEEKVLALEK